MGDFYVFPRQDSLICLTAVERVAVGVEAGTPDSLETGFDRWRRWNAWMKNIANSGKQAKR